MRGKEDMDQRGVTVSLINREARRLTRIKSLTDRLTLGSTGVFHSFIVPYHLQPLLKATKLLCDSTGRQVGR